MEQLKLLDLFSGASELTLGQRQRSQLIALMAGAIWIVHKKQKGKGDEDGKPQDKT